MLDHPRYAPGMRRYSVTEAPRAVLLDDLDHRIAHHEHNNPDEPRRAESYRLARLELEGGGIEARAWHTVFRVAMMRAETYHVYEGARDEIVAKLNEGGDSRAQQGSESGKDKARAFARALNSIAAGAVEVRVGDFVFRIVED
jgi:hypothetical protein